jgi:protein-S-isoprenylcysteine O-methyltransferase Ste14
LRRLLMVALKTLIFTILVPGTVLGLLPWLLLRWEGTARMPSLSIWLIGLFPLLIGVLLYFWCALSFTFIGKGTPAPIDAPVFLVRSGPYRWVRNPMYLGDFSVLLGEAILFHSRWLAGYALVMGLIVFLFVVFYEEPHLAHRFGESYEAYLRAVPRWLPQFSRRLAPDREVPGS